MSMKTKPQRICRVIAAYQSPYTDPVAFSAGEELAIAEKACEWPGWVWCTKRDGNSRWVPEAYVERRDDTGVMRRDYEATELSVSVGEELVMGEEEESEWVWCTNRGGRSGWVPLDNIEEVRCIGDLGLDSPLTGGCIIGGIEGLQFRTCTEKEDVQGW